MNRLKNLEPREKTLVLMMLALIVIVLLYFIVSSSYQQFFISKDQLDKSKTDYEYVLNRYKQIENSINSKLSKDKVKLSESIKVYLSSKDIKIESLIILDDDLVIKLHANKINESIEVVNDLSERYSLVLKNVAFQRKSDLISVEILAD
jgi:type II secretory pathway component PulM